MYVRARPRRPLRLSFAGARGTWLPSVPNEAQQPSGMQEVVIPVRPPGPFLPFLVHLGDSAAAGGLSHPVSSRLTHGLTPSLAPCRLCLSSLSSPSQASPL